ncbi:MAG: transporter substrate-binding domain-containing protein [Micrococcales bacterium]
MSKKNIFAAAALAVTSALVLVGCAAAPDSNNTADGSKIDAAAAALVPQEYKDAGEVNVGSDIPYAPMEMLDDAGNVTGFDYDLAQLIGEKLGLKFTFEKQSFDALIPSLEAGNHDAIMSGMSDTVERQAKLDFVDYFLGGSSLVINKGNPDGVTDLQSLCGKTAVIEAATVQGDTLAAVDCGDKGAITVLSFPDVPSTLNALRAGKGVAFLIDSPVAADAARTAGEGKYFELAVDPAAPAGYEPGFFGIGVLKGDKLALAIQAALQAAINDGSYQAVLDKWNLGTFAVTEATLNGTK